MESVPLPKRFVLSDGVRHFVLEQGRALLGRSPECHLVIDDSSVSRRHAMLVVTESCVTVRDLGSINGTFVESVRVRTVPEVLQPGDRVRVGNIDLELLTVEQAEALERPTLLEEKSSTGPRRLSATEAPTHARIVGVTTSKAPGEVGDVEETLAAVRAGRVVPPNLLEQAARRALEIAIEAQEPTGVDQAVELLLARRGPPPTHVVIKLQRALSSVRGADPDLLREYARALIASCGTLALDDRHLAQWVAEICAEAARG